MSDNDLLTEPDGGILRVTLNRPEKRNALSRSLLDALRRCFAGPATDPELRLVVLRGAGDKSFAAGGDLRDLDAVRSAEDARAMALDAKAALDAVRACPVPVLAVLNGSALGGGAELAMACDLRLMAAHARIGFIQGRLNIPTAWGGGVDLMRELGPALALRLLGRSEVLDAGTAAGLGLVQAVAGDGEDLDAVVEDFVEPFRRQVPQVMRAFKALAAAGRRNAPRAEMDAIETDHFIRAWVHDDHWDAAARVQLGGKQPQ